MTFLRLASGNVIEGLHFWWNNDVGFFLLLEVLAQIQ